MIRSFLNGKRRPLKFASATATLEKPALEEEVVFESWADLQNEFDNATGGSTIDLTGRSFRVGGYTTPEPKISNGGKDLTVIGGTFAGTAEVAWIPNGDGRFYASYSDLSLINDMRFYLADNNAASFPLATVRPEPPSAMNDYRFSKNDNWLVLTSLDGVDNGSVSVSKSTGLITGITITDATLKASVDGIITSAGTTKPVVVYRGYPNVITTTTVESWNNSTGVMVFGDNNLEYGGYFEFVFIGLPGLMQAGEYAVDLAESPPRVWYWPSNGNPKAAGIPCITCLFQLTGGSVEFDSCTFYGQLNSDQGMIDGQSVATVTLTDCTFHSGDTATTNSNLTMSGCHIYHMWDRGLHCRPGSTIESSIIEGMENRSAIVCWDASGYAADDTVPPTTIRDCLIRIPAPTHGEGIALYYDSWQNATVEHNIFHNCRMAISWKPTTSGTNSKVAGTFLIDNNLVVYPEESFVDIDSGQYAFAQSGSFDDHFDDDSQIVRICRNSLIVGSTLAADVLKRSVWSINVQNHHNSTTIVENNVAFGVLCFVEDADSSTPEIIDDWIGSHWRSKNLLLSDTWWSSYGKYDLGVGDDPISNFSYGDVVDFDNLSIVGDAAALGWDDGGGSNAPGIQWSSVPTLASLDSLSVNWASTYPAISLNIGGRVDPDVAENATTNPISEVFRGQDLRE